MCLVTTTFRNRYTGETVTAPCNKCPECRARRASAWSFRLRQEEKVSTSSYFITVTYDTLEVPITEKGRLSLRKKDVQKFIKRIRKSHADKSNDTSKSIKYYAVGEYGGRTWRPHYHLILFNADIQKMVNRTDQLKLRESLFDGQTEVMCKQWKFGHITVGQVNPASVGYTLKYICKPKKVPEYKGDDRQPEFSLMSKGLGVSYLTESMIKYHLADVENRMFCSVEGGVKLSMPRYYKNKLYNSEQKEKIKEFFYKKFVEETVAIWALQPWEIKQLKHNRYQAVQASYRWAKLITKKEKL